jgi:hypothetical protein
VAADLGEGTDFLDRLEADTSCGPGSWPGANWAFRTLFSPYPSIVGTLIFIETDAISFG